MTRGSFSFLSILPPADLIEVLERALQHHTKAACQAVLFDKLAMAYAKNGRIPYLHVRFGGFVTSGQLMSADSAEYIAKAIRVASTLGALALFKNSKWSTSKTEAAFALLF